ncbi:MAG: response regulator, partial [Chloroflexota bacterium]|nr:response regulator [Chloroflexota bacterium]
MQRILIADDDAAIRGVLRDLLQDEGFDVDEVDSGQGVIDALGKANSSRPSLVMMDVRMPDRTGLEVLREKRTTNGDQLPIIVMTAYGTSNVAIEAMQLGAYDYLTKPFD